MRFLINSNIFIAIGALLLTFESELLLGQDPAWHPYLFIIFFATFFEYNLHRLYTLVFYKEALKHPKHEWLRNNIPYFYILLSMSSIGLLVSCVLAKTKVLIALAPFAFLTLFYTVPLFVYKGEKKRLRDIPYLKLPLIALNWTFITILLPVFQHETDVSWQVMLPLCLERFLFIFTICIPFDIRDIDTDKQSQLKTFPTWLGVKSSWKLTTILMIFTTLFSAIYHGLHDGMLCSLAFLMSGVYTIVILKSNKARQSSFYHYGYVDGAIHIQALLVYIAFLIS